MAHQWMSVRLIFSDLSRFIHEKLKIIYNILYIFAAATFHHGPWTSKDSVADEKPGEESSTEKRDIAEKVC